LNPIPIPENKARQGRENGKWIMDMQKFQATGGRRNLIFLMDRNMRSAFDGWAEMSGVGGGC